MSKEKIIKVLRDKSQKSVIGWAVEESDFNLVADELLKLFTVKNQCLYRITHEHFATDRYRYGDTIVSATSSDEAFKKLNDHLSTKPDGHYTALPCRNIDDVKILNILT